MRRPDGRQPNQVRPLRITRHFLASTPGAVLIEAGRTRVLCTATVREEVPSFLAGKGRGWVTGEYGMLPASTGDRKARDRGGRVDGRTVEIQRLIGRALRAVVDFELLGERTIWIDCDVLEADGGTRTAAVTGGYVALADMVDALLAEQRIPSSPIREAVAAVSVGILRGTPLLDLCYAEDSRADVDMNVVMTEGGKLVEIQGTAETTPFEEADLSRLLALAREGIATHMATVRAARAS